MGSPTRCQADVPHAQPLQFLEVSFAPTATVVGVRTWRLPKLLDVLLDCADRELRVVKLLLVPAQRRQEEPTAEPRDPPVQPELHGLADLASYDGVELRDVEAD